MKEIVQVCRYILLHDLSVEFGSFSSALHTYYYLQRIKRNSLYTCTVEITTVFVKEN